MNNKRRPSRTVLFGDPTARRTFARVLVAIIAVAAVAIALVLIFAKAGDADSTATSAPSEQLAAPSQPGATDQSTQGIITQPAPATQSSETIHVTVATIRTVSLIPVSDQDFAALRSPEALADHESPADFDPANQPDPLADSCEADPPENPQVIATSANAEVATPASENPTQGTTLEEDANPAATVEETVAPDTAIEEVSAYTKNTTYTENDVWALGKLITAEAGSWWLPDELQLLVGNVALNHVDNPEFPGVYTVIDAIYDPGVYEPVSDLTYWDTVVPTERALRNARRLLEGERFCPKTVIFQAAFVQGELYAAIEDPYGILDTTYFCYSNYYSSYS